MIQVAADVLEVDQEQLLDEMKFVHQRYHNPEQPYAILEAASVVTRYPEASPLETQATFD